MGFLGTLFLNILKPFRNTCTFHNTCVYCNPVKHIDCMTRREDNLHGQNAWCSVPFFYISICLIPCILNHCSHTMNISKGFNTGDQIKDCTSFLTSALVSFKRCFTSQLFSCSAAFLSFNKTNFYPILQSIF